jgi:sugar O-acyltransferase (sialic acid O-acetyltransferase NeuD family)
MSNYLVWGTKGQSEVVIDLIRESDGHVVAFADNNAKTKSPLKGVELLRGQEDLRGWLQSYTCTEVLKGVVAIGGERGGDRLAIMSILEMEGLILPSLISRHATVSPRARISEGVQILPGAIVAAGAVLERGVIVNHKSSVDHETTVGAGSHLAPGTTVCGLVHIGERVFVGAGATVLPRLTLGSDSVIGAGSVVTHNVDVRAVVVGVPASNIKR